MAFVVSTIGGTPIASQATPGAFPVSVPDNSIVTDATGTGEILVGDVQSGGGPMTMLFPDGRVAWQRSTYHLIDAKFAHTGGTAFMAWQPSSTAEQRLTAIDPQDRTVWDIPVPPILPTYPSTLQVTDESIYFLAYSDQGPEIWVVDVTDGTETAWPVDHLPARISAWGAFGLTDRGPVLADDTEVVYFDWNGNESPPIQIDRPWSLPESHTDNNLVSISPSGTVAVMHKGPCGNGSNWAATFIQPNGTQNTYINPGEDFCGSSTIDAIVAIGHDSFSVSRNTSGGPGTTAFRADDGAILWTVPAHPARTIRPRTTGDSRGNTIIADNGHQRADGISCFDFCRVLIEAVASDGSTRTLLDLSPQEGTLAVASASAAGGQLAYVLTDFNQPEGNRSTLHVLIDGALGIPTFHVTDTGEDGLGDGIGAPVDLCGDGVFLGVPGSGQPSSPSGPDYGMGQPVATFYDLIRDAYAPDFTWSGRAVDYDPVDVPVGFSNGGLNYRFSLNQGRHGLRVLLQDLANECPGIPIVLAGYSQGAHSIRNVIDDPRGAAQALADQVVAVLLFGDPQFLSGDAAARGSFRSDALGLASSLGIIVPGASAQVPTGWTDRTRTFCNDGDIVCNGFPGGSAAHRTYSEDDRYEQDVLGFVAYRLEAAGFASRPEANLPPVPRLHLGRHTDGRVWVNAGAAYDPDGATTFFRFDMGADGTYDHESVDPGIVVSRTVRELRISAYDDRGSVATRTIPDLQEAANGPEFQLQDEPLVEVPPFPAASPPTDAALTASVIVSGDRGAATWTAPSELIPTAYALQVDGTVVALTPMLSAEFAIPAGIVVDGSSSWSVLAFDASAAVASPVVSATSGATLPVQRLAGANRIETAVSVARRGWPLGASHAVIASASSYADALAATPLATALNAPVLLTAPDVLSSGALEELRRLGVDAVTIVGGPAAVGVDIADALAATGYDVTRLAGATRFATAAAVAQGLRGLTGATGSAFVIEGANSDPARGWPDAISVAGLAAVAQAPILLATRDELPPETGDLLSAGDRVTIVGGEQAVSHQVVDQMLALGANVTRLSGADRFETSRVVAQAFLQLLGSDVASEDDGTANLGPVGSGTLLLATGDSYADALTAGPFAATTLSPTILISGHSTAANEAALAWRAAHATQLPFDVGIGGTAAIGDDVLNAFAQSH